MTLHPPFIISSRLMAAVEIGGATLSIEHGRRNREGRDCYGVWIDLPDGSEHAITDLRSGCQGGTLQEGMASLLSFLGAAAESYAYHMRTQRQTENEDLFEPAIVEWAYQNSDEIGMLACELEEMPNLIEE